MRRGGVNLLGQWPSAPAFGEQIREPAGDAKTVQKKAQL